MFEKENSSFNECLRAITGVVIFFVCSKTGWSLRGRYFRKLKNHIKYDFKKSPLKYKHIKSPSIPDGWPIGVY